MGERLPRVTGKEVLSALVRLGFSLHEQAAVTEDDFRAAL
jgi:hypothetical protein